VSTDSFIPTYVIAPQTPPPADYPFQPKPDEFTTRPFEPSYMARWESLMQFILDNPAPTNTNAPYYELARLVAGGTPHHGVFIAALDYIDARLDCADFTLHAILRLLYQFGKHPAISPEVQERAQKTVLGFKYWPDEPGIDSMCTWTENHYILFTSAAYLAGQLYPQMVFDNSGQTGEQKMALNRPRILQWMNLRFFTGFSEWLSHVYYDEDLVALLSLVDFCQDPQIQTRAAMIIDLLLLDMALNHFNGVFGSTHGRSYEDNKKWAALESTSSTHKLLFGRGAFSELDMMSAIAFALSSKYRAPEVLYEIANDQDREEMLNRQRMGIRLDQADWWGLKPRGLEDGMGLLTLEAYLHPFTANLFIKMLDAFNWWDNEFFSDFRARRGLLKFLRFSRLLPVVARLYEKDVCRNTREEVNLYTYRTPDYMLSSAQDYRPGYGGDQQHIWQATLGPDAVCFSTHPARRSGKTPNYWAGSGSLPRVAQIKNVLIAVYRITRTPALYVPNELFYTHAWLPRDHFDEVIERDGWIFARLHQGYLALLSQHPYEWHELPGEDQNREVIVRSPRNIWICELGRAAADGDFETFMGRILAASVTFRNSRVTYHSPSQGLIEFGWKGPLRHESREISLQDYPRYGNPYVQAAFPSEQIEVSLDERNMRLDWLNADRQVSDFMS
jgi:hypothetical protein